MPLQLKVQPNNDVVLKLKNSNTKKITLKIGKTLDGNLLVGDHHLLDIIVMPEKGKILALPKSEYNSEAYDDQDSLFQELLKAGIIIPDTITGGNIYGSIQAKFETKKINDEEPLDVILLGLYNFLNKEKQFYSRRKEFIDSLEKELLNPSDQSSTELGEIPQERNKGSIPRYGFPTRGIYRYNY